MRLLLSPIKIHTPLPSSPPPPGHIFTKELHIFILPGYPICERESTADILLNINILLILEQTLFSDFQARTSSLFVKQAPCPVCRFYASTQFCFLPYTLQRVIQDHLHHNHLGLLLNFKFGGSSTVSDNRAQLTAF